MSPAIEPLLPCRLAVDLCEGGRNQLGRERIRFPELIGGPHGGRLPIASALTNMSGRREAEIQNNAALSLAAERGDGQMARCVAKPGQAANSRSGIDGSKS